MPIISTSTGRSFSTTEDETILQASLKSDVGLPYSCRTGRCSSCKCKVVSGESVANADELGLTQEQKDGGWILSCVRSAKGDMVVEVDDLGDELLFKAKIIPCRIDGLVKLAPDVLVVHLRIPPKSRFEFHPGQYIELIGEAGVRRSYSIANAPAADNRLELHIRQVPDGVMSDYWFLRAKINDLLRINGPLGTFWLRELMGKTLVLLATGIGIAPVKAMLEGLVDADEKDRPTAISVYWGARTIEDLYLKNICEGVTHHFVPILSRTNALDTSTKDYVQDVFLKNTADLDDVVVYACGSEVMIESAHDLLTKAGLAEQRFFSDSFVCSAPIELTKKEN